MIKARTKIEAGLVSILMFSIVFSSVLNAVGPTITDSHGVRYQTLQNSKGNYWNSTQANLKLAVWDLNSTHGGWVMLPNNHGLTLTGFVNPYGAALINMTTYNSSKWSATSALVTAKSSAWNGSATGLNVTRITNSNGKYWPATGANLQLALNDLTTGGTVWIPAGTIYLPDALYITYNNTSLKGAGMYQSIIKMGIATAGHSLYVFGKQNIILSDFTYDGNNSYLGGGGQTNSHGIDVRGTKNFTLQNVRILHPAGTGLVLGDDAYDTFIANGYGVINFFIDNYVCEGIAGTGAQHGILMQWGKNGIINNVHINGSYYVGDGIDINDYCTNCTFNNMYISNITGDGWKINDHCDNITMTNIFMQNINGNGIKLADTGGIIKKMQLSNVNIRCKGNSGCIYFQGTGEIHDFSMNGFLLSNDHASTSGDGINIEHPTVSNVSFSNGEIWNASYLGIYCLGTKDIYFTNVKVTRSNLYAIYLENVNRTIIDGCYFKTIGNSNLFVMKGCSNVTISNSYLEDTYASRGAINITGTTITKDFIITGNRIYGHQYCVSIPGAIGHRNFIITNNILWCGSGHTTIVDHSVSTNVTVHNLGWP
jgi:hypothetical protein